MSIDPDQLHRTVKLEMDSGRARDVKDAERIVGEYMLQVRVGAGVAGSQTRQAALLTAVNVGSRAFLGGVRVKMDEDFELTTAWDRGRGAAETLADFDGASVVDELDRHRPVIIFGDADFAGELPVYTTWDGWAAGVVPSPAERLGEQQELALAGVLSGALAVSEAFQWTRGYRVAATRSVGLSLWAPGCDWRLAEAVGPPLRFLPDNFWLLGLGHLGQAYAWTLGFLPFSAATRGRVRVMLQDVEEIVKANEATSMLVRNGARGLKTHLAARELERIGLEALITDRRFNEHTRRSDIEPAERRLALAGFDKIAPRRLLEDAGFNCVVDAGLGVGPTEYLGVDVHSFPSSRTAREVFLDGESTGADEELLDRPAYRAATEEAVRHGNAASLEAARCGLIDVAGRAAGAAFVGAVAATIAISELVRIVNGGDRYETITMNLRTPDGLVAYRSPVEKTIRNPGFIEASRC
jgi:hypothetical protein